jgi:hypothetical protein
MRYGYRRVRVMLRGEGWIINQKKTRRICNELGPQVRNKTPKRQVKANSATIVRRQCNRTKPGRWILSMTNWRRGKKIRVLTDVDTFSRFPPSLIRASAIGPRTSSKCSLPESNYQGRHTGLLEAGKADRQRVY